MKRRNKIPRIQPVAAAPAGTLTNAQAVTRYVQAYIAARPPMRPVLYVIGSLSILA
jgi:hypothetical protein